MKLLTMILKDYKSIQNSGEIIFNEKINIFAGKNNTGKTAFIESLYNSVNCIVENHLSPDLNTSIQLEVSINEEELNILNAGMPEEYHIDGISKLKISYLYSLESNYNYLEMIDGYDENSNMYINLYGRSRQISSNGYFPYVFTHTPGRGTTFSDRPQFINNTFTFLKENIVFISGNRYVPKVQTTQLDDILSIDGANLNSFLYTLHNNHEWVFDKIKSVFIDIFNDVESISTPINDNNSTYISLRFEGNPVPIPLSNCGSGYTHVLILLCVLFTKNESVVLFDEPHVYLHPSAEKAIYDLINETKQHQYLLTTHSPILINYPFEKNIFHVKKQNGLSEFSELGSIQALLDEIGIKNSDFALSDRVLFVEGETEEEVIPLILSHFGMRQIGYNYKILKMKGTGNEFIKKTAMTRNKEKLDLILSGVSDSPIPYRIIIDSDEKTDDKLSEIKQKYQDTVVILDRREFENYFLDCYEEITKVININAESEVTNFENVKNDIEEILTLVDNKKLYPREISLPIKNVVGSQVLEMLFEKYDLSYNKVVHGAQVTTLVLQMNPEKFRFIVDSLGGFIKTTTPMSTIN